MIRRLIGWMPFILIPGLCHAQPLVLTEPQKLATLEAFHRLQVGLPPATDGRIKDSKFAQLESDLDNLQRQLGTQTSPLSEKCQRFVSVSDKLAKDLVVDARSLSLRQSFMTEPLSDFDFELTNHTRIAGAAFSELAFLVQQNAEGGYSVLDRQATVACPFFNRDQLVSTFTASIESLNKLFQAILGTPGIFAMEEAQQRLLKLEMADQAVRQKHFWLAMGALTVASVTLWEFGPSIVAGSLRLLWGYTPRLFAVPAFLYGVKVSGLVAEGVAFSYADEWTSNSLLPPKIFIGSWDEHMNSIESFLESPLHSPQMELVFLSRIHALILADTAQWFAPASSFLREEEQKWGSIENAMTHYQATQTRTDAIEKPR